MNAATIVDIDMLTFEEIIHSLFEVPRDIVLEVGEFLVPYDEEGSAAEWIGENNQYSILSWILSEGKWSIDDLSDCFTQAIASEHVDLCRSMLAHAIDRDYKVEKYIVLSCIRQGSVELTELFLRGVSWGEEDLNFFLCASISEDQMTITEAITLVEFQIEGYVLINSCGDHCLTKLLLTMQDNWEEKDLETCLFIAVQNEDLDLAELLLEYGANPDVIDNSDLESELMNELLNSYR